MCVQHGPGSKVPGRHTGQQDEEAGSRALESFGGCGGVIKMKSYILGLVLTSGGVESEKAENKARAVSLV